MLTRFLFLVLLSSLCLAGSQEGIAALNRGDYEEAYRQFLPLAEAGDDKAMITIALLYHQGQGFKQDYNQAMDWYIKAFRKGNGDAYSNIGVMYRDGLGVAKNRKMAYCLFLITHVCGLGSESTQYRANSCLSRIITEMPHAEFVECFDYTVEYIEAYVLSKGTLKDIPDNCKPSKERLSLKDKPWWLEGELDFLQTKTSRESDRALNDQLPGKLTRESHLIEIGVPSIHEIGNVVIKSQDYDFTIKEFEIVSENNGVESVSVLLNGPVPPQITVNAEYAGKKYNGIYQLDPNIPNRQSLYKVTFTLDDNKLVSSCRVSSLQSPRKAYGSTSETVWYFDDLGNVINVEKAHVINSNQVVQQYIIGDSGIRLYKLGAKVQDFRIWYYLSDSQVINKIEILTYGQNSMNTEISYDSQGKIISCMAYNEKTKKYDIPTENTLSNELPKIKDDFKNYYRQYDVKQIAFQDGVLLPK